MVKFISELGKEKLRGKKVLLRVDFNVPIVEEKIAEVFRIKAVRETVDYLLESGAKVALVSHIEAIPGFGPIAEQIGEILGQTLTLVPFSELAAVGKLFEASPVLLLENIRQDGREIQNDKGFAEELARGFDFYVNDGFAVCHRKHASVSAITKFLPSYAGFLIKKETEKLSEALKAPVEGKVIVLGGAKISTKLPVIKNFLDKAEKILIGGAIANSFFKARGIQIGASVVDDTVVDVSDPKIVLPEIVVVTDDKTGKSRATSMPVGDIAPNQMIVDICPEFAEKFAEIIERSRMVVWNGPMGLSEIETFAGGTKVIARAVASAPHSIVGGGDTIAAADKLGLLDKFTFVSTGGGAMLEFLAGKELPGLEALEYYS
jgi:phosphoglycerate kinase